MYTATVNALSQMFDRDRRTVSNRLADAGIQSEGKDDKGHAVYLVSKVAPLLVKLSNVPNVDPDTLPPKERLEWYRGEMERLKLAEQNRELIRAAEMEFEMAQVIKTTIAGLEALPDKLERKIALTGSQIESMTREINQMREELYEKLISLPGYDEK